MPLNDFSDRLKEERTRLGLSQAELGEACGVQKLAQFNYEKGERMPDAAYLMKAAALGLDTCYLITGERKATIEVMSSTNPEIPLLNNESSVGFRIKEERLRLGFNQPDFAAIVGVSKRTVIDWEKDVSSPTAAQLSVFVKFGVNALYVLTGQMLMLASGISPVSEEMALIGHYRRADETGKKAIEVIASALANATTAAV